MQDGVVRVGILGFGDRGVSFVAPILNNHIGNRLTTVIDPDLSRSRFYLDQCVKGGHIPADEAEQIRFVADISELKPDEVDALFLAATEQVRTQVFAQAVATGAHLYMEKGLSVDLDGARAVVAAMPKPASDQRVFMGFNLRHFPAAVAAKRAIDEGRIGRVLHVQYLEMMRFTHGGSFFMRFHRDVGNSGGMLVTKSCHDFDLLGCLVSARPERVFSARYRRLFGRGGAEARDQCHTCDRTQDCDFDRMGMQPTRAAKRRYAKVYLDEDKVTTDGYFRDLCCWRDDTELRDLSSVMFEFENGVPATYTQVLFAPVGNRIIRVFGDRGSLVFDENERSVTVLDRFATQTDRVVCKPVSDGHGGSDTGVVAAFFRMVRQGEAPQSTIADGVWALASAAAAYRSADTEQWVKVRPLVEAVGPGLE